MTSAQQELFATLTSVLDHHPHQLSLLEVKPLPSFFYPSRPRWAAKESLRRTAKPQRSC